MSVESPGGDVLRDFADRLLRVLVEALGFLTFLDFLGVGGFRGFRGFRGFAGFGAFDAGAGAAAAPSSSYQNLSSLCFWAWSAAGSEACRDGPAWHRIAPGQPCDEQKHN